jgi:nucleotide-binding universal stress UspA family protein
VLKTILLPLDRSALAERALEYSTALARSTGARVLLLRAAMSHTLVGVDGRERLAGAIDELAMYLQAVATQLPEPYRPVGLRGEDVGEPLTHSFPTATGTATLHGHRWDKGERRTCSRTF